MTMVGLVLSIWASGAPSGAVGSGGGQGRASVLSPSTVVRSLPSPLYGVTVDDVDDLDAIVDSAEHLPEMPITRIYFDVREPVSYYSAAVTALHPVSCLMGELLDSSDETKISPRAYDKSVKAFVSTFGRQVDVWEVGIEVNGDWTGRYRVVARKLTEAFDDMDTAGGRSALTLYYNVGCGDGRAELDPLAFSRAYVPASVRDGLTYVFLSYYEDEWQGIRPDLATWTGYYRQLHRLYPNALLGFGEIGLSKPVSPSTLSSAASLMAYYYGLALLRPRRRPPVLRRWLLLVVLRRGLAALPEPPLVGGPELSLRDEAAALAWPAARPPRP